MNLKLIAAVFCTVASLTLVAETKFGTVDLMMLVKNHPNYESNKTLLTSTKKDYDKKLDAIKGEGEKLQEEGKQLLEQLNNPMLLSKAKADAESQVKEIQKKLAAIEQRYRSEAMRCSQDLQDLETRLLKTTTDDLRKRIAKYAEANGYDFIFDLNAAPYAKDSYNVTDALLSSMGVDPKNARGKEKNEGK